jgi:hypothetical protein
MGRQGMDRPAMGPQGMGQPGMGRMGRGARFQGEFFAGGPRADAPRQARLRRHDCNCPYCPQGGDRMMLRRQDRDCWADELSQMIGAELNPETEPAVNAEAVDIEREHLQETIDRLEEEIGDLQERLNQPTGN